MKTLQKIKSPFSHTDLTHGPIAKTIVRFSLPIFISYLLQSVYAMADAAICGHTLSAGEVAGVNDTSAITFLFLQFAFGCTAGMSVVISHHAGRNDNDGMRKAFAAQIVLSALVCLAVTGISLFTIKPLLRLIGVAPSGDPVGNEVYRAAYIYLAIVCGGMVGQFFYNSICGVLRSIGDSFTPLVFLFVSTVLNIALDFLFIMAFGWGVAGAAIATVAAQILSAVACLVFTFVRYPQLRLRARDFRFPFSVVKRMLWQGIPLGFQFSVVGLGILSMSNGVIAFDKLPNGSMTAGTPAQLGYGAGCKINNLLYTPINALGTSMLSFCGQNEGAGNRERIRRSIKQSMLMLLVLSLALSAVGLSLTVGGVYQKLFLADSKITPQTIRFGNVYMYTVLPFMFALGTIFVLRNVVQGLGKPLVPLIAGIGELFARIAVCLLLPQIVNGGAVNSNASSLAFSALSLADPVAWIAADIPLAIATYLYIRKKKPSEIPFPHKKILVVGCGGAGKSTFARAMGEKLGIPVVHLDKLWWQPNWIERTPEEFDSLLADSLSQSQWITDGNYRRTFPLRLQNADFCVFLDIDAKTCMKSVYKRAKTYKGKTRPDITDGCVEQVDPEFAEWIHNFSQSVRPEMLAELHKSGVPYRIFTARKDAYLWLNALQPEPSARNSEQPISQ
ncbi:MAG: hypothetical protein HFE47_03240 [Clostridia bacterium]|nr:hypothetical protein [Clostridia bacterium]